MKEKLFVIKKKNKYLNANGPFGSWTKFISNAEYFNVSHVKESLTDKNLALEKNEKWVEIEIREKK